MSINPNELRKLGLSDELVHHLERDDRDDPLWYRCRRAEHWRSSPIALRQITPLWECGVVVAYFNKETNRFERCSLEAIDDVWCRHASLQSLLAELFIDCFEDELEESELRDYAERFGFRHIDRLLPELATGPQGENYKEWRQCLARKCT